MMRYGLIMEEAMHLLRASSTDALCGPRSREWFATVGRIIAALGAKDCLPRPVLFLA